MPGRFGLLSLTALAVALAAFGDARAHGLDAQAFLLPGGKQVRIEGWFDNGRVARGAKVRVSGAKGQPLAEGTLDQDGKFVFALPEPEALRVVVTATGGHRKDLEVSAEELRNSVAAEETPSAAAAPGEARTEAVPLTARHSWEDRVKDLLIGIGLLLALAAFGLSWRNARQLRRLMKQ